MGGPVQGRPPCSRFCVALTYQATASRLASVKRFHPGFLGRDLRDRLHSPLPETAWIRSPFPRRFVPRTAAQQFRGTFPGTSAERNLTEQMFETSHGKRSRQPGPRVSESHDHNVPLAWQERKYSNGPRTYFHGSFRSKTKTLDLQGGVLQLNRADPSESFACTSHLHPAQARPPLERAPSRSFCASPRDAHKDAAPSPSVPT